jgi:Tol biopolymer transport system component
LSEAGWPGNLSRLEANRMTDNDRGQPRLESWKEIGAYLQRDVRTARRWELDEGLPVHRHSHKSRSSVYAYPSELDAWRASRRVAAEPPPPPPLWKTLLAVPRSAAFGLTVALCLITVGAGVRPRVASAQQSGGERMRQIPFLSGMEAPSPDGRYLTYTDWSTGDLAVRDLTTGTKRRLTADGGLDKAGVNRSGYADSAMISPDDRLVAYPFVDAKHDRVELRVVPFSETDGRNPPILHRSDETRDLSLDGWTPDSKSILITRQLTDQTSQLDMVSIEDGSLRVLKSFSWKTLGSAALSPDGRYVAYSGAVSDTDWDIFVLASDGSKQGKLTAGPAVDSFPVWSPDSSQILFISDRTGSSESMWAVPVNEGKASGPARLVKDDFGSGHFFPVGMTRSGALYFFSGGSGENVYTAEFDANMKLAKPPEPVTQRFVNSNSGGSWSPDGAFLAYYVHRAPSQTIPGGTDLIIRTLKTGAERAVSMPQLTVPPYIFTAPPRWFPDGKSVMVVSYALRHPGVSFYRVDLENGKAELLHTTRASPFTPFIRPDLSPDGKAIFYTDTLDLANSVQLMRFDLDTKRETELKRVQAGQSFSAIAVSPDGKQLAYGVMDNPTGTAAAVSSLEVMPVSGGKAHEVYHGRMGAFQLAWSPDQRYLFFNRAGRGLWRIAAAGGEPAKTGLARPGFFPQFHPDGRRIVFERGGQGTQQLWVMENFLSSGLLSQARK